MGGEVRRQDRLVASRRAAGGAGRRAVRRRLRRDRPRGRSRRPGLPAPLPGPARRRGVPGAVRGRDRSDRPARRPARATSGDHRPRRRCLHHAHPAHPRHVRKDLLMTQVDRDQLEGLGRYAFGWADSDVAGAAATRGLSEAKVREISALKSEPEWMLDFRLKGLRLFDKKPMPNWGADLSGIDFDNIKYFVQSSEKQAASWEELPADIKNTYDRLGIPEAEKQRLIAGVAAQYECLAADTRVWTANRGLAFIKEIEPGDVVFAYDDDAGRLIPVPVKAAAQTDVRQ